MNKQTWIWIAVIVIAIAGVSWLAWRDNALKNSGTQADMPAQSGVLQIVAAENFWGSLASQLGGTHVNVFSVVSDPNADPHEYESNATDARAVATANYVIENGAGYDSWMEKLVGAGNSSSPHRKILDIADLLGKKDGDNPHVWYDPDYVNAAVGQMEQDLITLDPVNAAYYQTRYQNLQALLAPYQNRIAAIKQQYAGTKVAATEDIFDYLASSTGLDLVSPPAFTEAVAEGNDPPAQSIVTFIDQLKTPGIKILVYNEQTVTPLTDNMKQLAAEQNIPTVGITETIQPPTMSFEDWMDMQVTEIENALGKSN